MQETAEAPAAEEEAFPPSAERRARTATDPRGIPRETIVYELSEEERRCPGCGEVRGEIGRVRSEQLEYIPPQYKVLVHERVKYACQKCRSTWPSPPSRRRRWKRVSPGRVSWLIRCWRSTGTTRRSIARKTFTRHGIILRRSTLCDWIAAAADLVEPLYRQCANWCCNRGSSRPTTHREATGLVLGRARTARFWAYLGDLRRPYTVYDFTDSRPATDRSFLKDLPGICRPMPSAVTTGFMRAARSSRSLVRGACAPQVARRPHDRCGPGGTVRWC